MTNQVGSESVSGRDNSEAPALNNLAAPANFNFASRAPIKIPKFTPEVSEVWFQQVNWILKEIEVTSSDKKFRAVIKTQDLRYACEIRDLVLVQTAIEPFKKLKP